MPRVEFFKGVPRSIFRAQTNNPMYAFTRNEIEAIVEPVYTPTRRRVNERVCLRREPRLRRSISSVPFILPLEA